MEFGWSLYTRRAVSVVSHAQDEARTRGDTAITTGDLLLGLLAGGTDSAAQVLTELGVSGTALRATLATRRSRMSEAVDGDLPFAQDATRALLAAARISEASGKDYVGTEHLLLGAVEAEDADDTSPGLSELGVDASLVRSRLRRDVARPSSRSEPALAPLRRRGRVIGKLQPALAALAATMDGDAVVVGARLEPVVVLGPETLEVAPLAMKLPLDAERALARDLRTSAVQEPSAVRVWMAGDWVAPAGSTVTLYAPNGRDEAPAEAEAVLGSGRSRIVLEIPWTSPTAPVELLIVVRAA